MWRWLLLEIVRWVKLTYCCGMWTNSIKWHILRQSEWILKLKLSPLMGWRSKCKYGIPQARKDLKPSPKLITREQQESSSSILLMTGRHLIAWKIGSSRSTRVSLTTSLRSWWAINQMSLIPSDRYQKPRGKHWLKNMEYSL